MAAIGKALKGAADDIVHPFSGSGDDVEAAKGKDPADGSTPPDGGDGKDGKKDRSPEPLWFGPKEVGPIVIELHGPMQLVFWFLTAVAIGGMCIECIRGKKNWWGLGFVGHVGFFLCAAYLSWIGKAIYILKMFRREIERLKACNEEYEKQNKEHAKLNGELQDKINDLGKVEDQLKILANECAGSVEAAKALLTKLEGSVKLNCVSAIFVFFDKADRNSNGKIDESEVDLFVQNLSFLFSHLPQFNKDDMKATLKAQGGISLEQVNDLVNAIMVADDASKLKATVSFKSGGSPSPPSGTDAPPMPGPIGADDG